MPLFRSEWIRTNSLHNIVPGGERAHMLLEQSGCAVLGFLLKVGVELGSVTQTCFKLLLRLSISKAFPLYFSIGQGF